MKRPLALVLAALLLAGCTKAGTPSSSAPAAGGAGGARHPYTVPHVLRYATAEDVAGLNPHLSQQTTLLFMSSLTMAWLTKFDRNNRPVPELTTEVPTQQNGGISKDGLTITWHLRHGVKWSDGQPFSADDVVFSTKAVLNMANNEIGRDGWDLITRIDEPDKYTVVYHLKQKYASYAASFFGSAGANPCVLPKHLLGNLPNINNAPYNALPVGIGPFRYTRWKRGDAVEMEANPYYFRGLPKLKQVVFKIVPDRNTVLTQIQTHELDLWLPVAAAYYDRLKAIPGVELLRQPSYYFSHLDFQNQHPPLDDVRVRRALRLGMDRKTINAKIRHGLGIIQDDPVSPTNPSFDKAVPTDPYDPAQANKLLDAAGWAMGPSGVRTKNGKPLNFVFATSTGSPDADQQIELIRANWKQLGVDDRRAALPLPAAVRPVRQRRDRLRRQVGHHHLPVGRRRDRRPLDPLLLRRDPAQGPERRALVQPQGERRDGGVQARVRRAEAPALRRHRAERDRERRAGHRALGQRGRLRLQQRPQGLPPQPGLAVRRLHERRHLRSSS